MAGLQDIAPTAAKPVGQQSRPGAHAGGGGRGLAAGVASSDHNDIERIHH